jgi:hypothetical protein
MKVTNWRRKLAASLVAGGLLAPGAVCAQSLNTNLVSNPSFETVGVTTCCYSATEVLNWTDGSQTGFAYNTVQGYDVGGPLAGGGSFYFTPNADNGIADITAPGQVSQNISVTSGAAAAQIASGEAAVKLSAYFTSFATDSDLGNLHVEFLNAGGTSLGSTLITARSPITNWHQVASAAFIPVGTATLRTSVFGTPVTFGPDGYTDLVDVQVTEAANELLFLEVNTMSGEVKIKNQSGDPFRIDFYEILAPGATPGDYNNNGTVDAADYTAWRNVLGQSVTLPNDSTPGTVTQADYDVWKANFGRGSNALDPIAWNSLQEQNRPGFPAGNGTGNGWEQAGGSDGGVLAEAFLTGNSLVAHNTEIPLGAAFKVGSPHNLEFRYGVVADDGMGGFTGPGTFVRGFVRYVPAVAGSAGTVPEPSSILLVGAGLATFAAGGRGARRRCRKS